MTFMYIRIRTSTLKKIEKAVQFSVYPAGILMLLIVIFASITVITGNNLLNYISICLTLFWIIAPPFLIGALINIMYNAIKELGTTKDEIKESLNGLRINVRGRKREKQ